MESPQSPPERKGDQRVKAMFTLYLLVLIAGICFFTVVGLTHQY